MTTKLTMPVTRPKLEFESTKEVVFFVTCVALVLLLLITGSVGVDAYNQLPDEEKETQPEPGWSIFIVIVSTLVLAAGVGYVIWTVVDQKRTMVKISPVKTS